jgi:hypothetical protein
VGIRRIKNDKAQGCKGKSRSLKNRKKSLFKGFLAVFFALLMIVALGFIRYGKQHFFSAPSIHLDDFLSGPYEISPEGAFIIPFDQRMNKASVISSLEIHPNIEGEWIWEGRVLKIQPKKDFQTGDEYFISIQKRAENIFGQHLQRSYELHYEVGFDPQIRAVYPAEDLLNEGDHITILFSHAMISREEFSKKYKRKLFQIAPRIDGEWKWYNEKILAFHPAQDWQKSTQYILQSSGALETLDGAKINQKISRIYQTTHFNLRHEDEEVLEHDIKIPFQISFNQAPNLQSLKKSLSLRNKEGKDVEVIVAYGEDSRDVLIRHVDGEWGYDQEYELFLKEGLVPAIGNLVLEESYEKKYLTESFFMIEKDEDGKVYYNSEKNMIEFSFRSDLDEEIAKSRLTVSPPYSWSLSKSGERFYLTFDDYSQKRENMKITYLEENEGGSRHSPVEIVVNPAPPLKFSVSDFDQVICIASNNQLMRTSSLVQKEKGVRAVAKLKNDKEERCPKKESLYTSYFEKKHFAPNTNHELQLRLTDVYGNVKNENQSVITKNIKTDERKLSRDSSLFYHNVSNSDDLRFKYVTENIGKVLVTLCKVDAKFALEIETAYEQRWFSFDPTPEKCLKFKRIEKELPSKWGVERVNELSVKEMTEEIDTGLYYFHIVAPGYFTARGDPLETNIALQYSEWTMLSKRASSSFIWLYDQKENTPVADAMVSLVSNDGLVLDIRKTDNNGTILLPDNKLKYDFILAKRGNEELLLSVFSQEGIEASRYDIPLDVRDQKFQHQFYIEDPSQNDDNFKGLFILKSITEKGLSNPNTSQAVVALYDQDEKLLWRSYEDFDEFGSLIFSVPQRLMILGGRYQLEVCLGLHQGICQGESFWTFFNSDSENFLTFKDHPLNLDENLSTDRIIQTGANEELEVGEDLPILLENLIPGIPVVITAERNAVYWHEILTPETSSIKTSFTITEEMMPELVISTLQIGKNEFTADMRSIAISRKDKELSFSSDPINNKRPGLKNSKNKELTAFSYTGFALFGSGSSLKHKALETFYPRLGTSVISAANIPYTLIDKQAPIFQKVSMNRLHDAVIIDGVLLDEDQDEYLAAKQYVIAHDAEGGFGNVLFGEIKYDDSLEINTDLPSFIRPADKVVYLADIENKTKETKNLQIINSSPHMRFPNGASIFVGIPADEKRTLNIAAEISPTTVNNLSNVSMSIAEKGSIISSSSVVIPVIHEEGLLPQKNFIQSQSNELLVNIDLPLSIPGEWKVSTVVAPSPVAFVLENLRIVLSSKTIDIEEMVKKMGLVADYKETVLLQSEEDSSVPLHNELAYLQDLQFSSGGWAHFGAADAANPLLSASIANSLSLMVNADQEVSEEMLQKLKQYLKQTLDEKSNERVRSERTASEMSNQESFEELMVLHGLSSLTLSGVSYANNWYVHRESLDRSSLVLLLLVFEDYRDAGLDGTLFKIEEIIQMLKQQSSTASGKSWLKTSSQMEQKVNDFVISSWYLEALVRQASSHSDIPPVINWLIEQKNLQKNQSLFRQSAFLQAMGSYLKVYQEKINSPEITIDSVTKNISYDLKQEKKGQAFFLEELLNVKEEPGKQSIRISSEEAQPLFVEVITQSKELQRYAAEKGLAVFHDFENSQVEVGDEIIGDVILVSDEPRTRVVVIQPQISGAAPLALDNTEENWVTLNSGAHEKWYVISDLPEGETRLPFRWKAMKPGVYQVPAVYAYESRAPEIYGTSQAGVVEIR